MSRELTAEELDATHHQLVIARQKNCDLEAMLRHERLERHNANPLISLPKET